MGAGHPSGRNAGASPRRDPLSPRLRIYTRRGDDGTTGLFHGGRVRKDSPIVEACGAVDEAQAVIGAARALVARGSELDLLLVRLERDLWVLMAELATADEHRDRLVASRSLVTAEMVAGLEPVIDDVTSRFEVPAEFAVPGGSPASAALDVARTVVRRAERRSLAVAVEGSFVVPYLNRLSDLLWTLARWQEDQFLPARAARPDRAEEEPS